MPVLQSFVVAALVLVSVAALSATGSATGEVPWQHARTVAGPPLPGRLVADERQTVVVSETGDAMAFDAVGAAQWKVTVPGESLVDLALSDLAVVVSGDEQISALDRGDGHVRWELALPPSRLAAGNDPAGRPIALATTEDGALVRIDVSSGEARTLDWSPDPTPNVQPHVSIEGSYATLAWSTDGACCWLAGLDLTTDEVVWTRKVRGSIVPMLHDGVLVTVTRPRRGTRSVARAFDVATGAPRWTQPVRGRFSTRLEAAGRDGVVVVVDEEGIVTALDAGDGAVLWSTATDAPDGAAHPSIAGTRVFLPRYGVELLELDGATGEQLERWILTRDGVVTSTVGTADRYEVLLASGALETAIITFAPAGSGGADGAVGP